MAFDPNLPATNAPIVSAELRNQFNGLKELIDALGPMLVPVGAIVAWAKSLPGTPALSANFVECNGQVLSDVASPLNGQTIPNLNGASGGTQRFLRGASASGAVGGTEAHTHDVAFAYSGVQSEMGGSGYAADNSPVASTSASSLPSYYEVVFVMRVK